MCIRDRYDLLTKQQRAREAKGKASSNHDGRGERGGGVLVSSFRLRRHRYENYWAELRCKKRAVKRWRRQYLTRHALDLWYIFTLRAVSARAVEALDFVREWQRSEWDEWVARFEYRRDSAVAVAILIEWDRVASGRPPLLDSSSAEASPSNSSTSSSASSHEWFPRWLVEEMGFDPWAAETNQIV